MRRRRKMAKRKSKKLFRNTARKVHKRNIVTSRAMRGGTRM